MGWLREHDQKVNTNKWNITKLQIIAKTHSILIRLWTEIEVGNEHKFFKWFLLDSSGKWILKIASLRWHDTIQMGEIMHISVNNNEN